MNVNLDGSADGEGHASVVGSPEAVAEQLRGFLDLGFDAVNLIVAGGEPRAQVERLGREVLPALRS